MKEDKFATYVCSAREWPTAEVSAFDYEEAAAIYAEDLDIPSKDLDIAFPMDVDVVLPTGETVVVSVEANIEVRYVGFTKA